MAWISKSGFLRWVAEAASGEASHLRSRIRSYIRGHLPTTTAKPKETPPIPTESCPLSKRT